MSAEKVVVPSPVTPTSGDIESSGRKRQARTSERDYDGGDEGVALNLFDYLVHNTITDMDDRPLPESRLSTLHSSMSSITRKKSRSLRLKHYDKTSWDEGSNDTVDLPPESAPSHVSSFVTAASESCSSLNASALSFRHPVSPRSPRHSSTSSFNHLGRIKRYSSQVDAPQTIVSSESDDSDNKVEQVVARTGISTLPSTSYDDGSTDDQGAFVFADGHTDDSGSSSDPSTHRIESRSAQHSHSRPSPIMPEPSDDSHSESSRSAAQDYYGATSLRPQISHWEQQDGKGDAGEDGVTSLRPRISHMDQASSTPRKEDEYAIDYLSPDQTPPASFDYESSQDGSDHSQQHQQQTKGALRMPALNPFDSLLDSTIDPSTAEVTYDNPFDALDHAEAVGSTFKNNPEESEDTPGPSQSTAIMMASLAKAAAMKRVNEQAREEVTEAEKELEPAIKEARQTSNGHGPIRDGGDSAQELTGDEGSRIRSAQQRRMELKQRQAAAMAIAAAARSQRGNLAHNTQPIEKKPSIQPPIPKEMVKLRSTPSAQETKQEEGTEPMRLVQLRSTPEKAPSTAVSELAEPHRMANLRSPEDRDEARRRRRMELEQKKRELENIARDASARRQQQKALQEKERHVSQEHQAVEERAQSSVGDGSESSSLVLPHGKPVVSSSGEQLYSYSPKGRTPNIDVYTGELIGEMPKVRTLLKKASSRDDADDESDSEFSETSYDTPVAKSKIHWGGFLASFMFIALGVGVYFGFFFDWENRGSGSSESATIAPTASPSLATNPASVATLPASRPTNTPSLRPTSRTTVPFVDIIQPSVSTPPSATATSGDVTNVDEEDSANSEVALTNVVLNLFEDLLSEWPLLGSSAFDISSPQRLALEWLSQNTNLDSYSLNRKKQRFALATFYFATGGDNWLFDIGWLSQDNECSWFSNSISRPQCDANNAYTNLELDLNDVSGTLPPELGLLSNSLKRLDISQVGDGPSLGGSMPSELGLLTNLEYLNLRGNQLTGSLPTEIGGLSRLFTLQIRDNLLGGNIPSEIGLLSFLEEFNVQNNALDGGLPTQVGRLSLLTVLSISDNNLSGPIPSEIENIISLRNFLVERNAMTAVPSQIGSLPLLQNLMLNDNMIEGSLPTELGNLSFLATLSLSGNLLTGTIPSTLGSLTLIRSLIDLSDNRLSGTIPSQLGNLSSLRTLLLNGNQLTGGVPLSFQSMNRLNTLRLESNDLTGPVPSAVCTVFESSLPAFVSDCGESVLDCDCCSYCCVDGADCQCQFADTPGLAFLCNLGFE